RRGDPRRGRPGELGQPLPPATVRWHAAAGGTGEGTGGRPRGAVLRRAVLGARSAHPQGDAGRADRPPAPAPADDRLHHPRLRRGDKARRPDRHHEGRFVRPDRHTRRVDRRSGHRLRPRVHQGRPQTEGGDRWHGGDRPEVGDGQRAQGGGHRHYRKDPPRPPRRSLSDRRRRRRRPSHRLRRPGGGDPDAGDMTASTAPLEMLAGADRVRRYAPWVLLVVGVAVLQVSYHGEPFPRAWDTVISDPINAFQAWARSNRRTHPLFTFFFTPLSRSIDWALTSVEGFLQWLPWYVVPGATFLLIARTRRWWPAAVAALASVYPGIVGLWDETMQTLALMAIAVFICLVIGIPLGVAAAFSRRLESVMRPVLDAMQTVPAPIYFIPMILFLGIGRVPATIATVIYALPPIIRLTALG